MKQTRTSGVCLSVCLDYFVLSVLQSTGTDSGNRVDLDKQSQFARPQGPQAPSEMKLEKKSGIDGVLDCLPRMRSSRRCLILMKLGGRRNPDG